MDAKIIAFVGMSGAGKSEAARYLSQKHIPSVRFGDITDEGLRQEGLEINPENEQKFREKIRHELGMAAYAIQSLPKIENLIREQRLIAIDGLYSWEEYLFLKEKFPSFFLIHIFAEPKVRYRRLATRAIRPFTEEEARNRDLMELGMLHKGGPIAIADFLIDNSNEKMDEFYAKIDTILKKI